jgi:K+-sensing histidine kinase KdpD
MAQFFSKRRLKIAEQIIIVSFFAVLIPMTVTGFIVNNINQQSNREQLKSAAVMIANTVSEEIDVFEQSIKNDLGQIVTTLEYYSASGTEQRYLDEITKTLEFYKELTIVNNKAQLEQYRAYSMRDNYYVLKRRLKDGRYLVAILDVEGLKRNLFKTLTEDQRQIYVLDNNGDLIASSNYTEKGYNTSLSELPKNLEIDKPIIYGKVKNQPLVYLKKSNPEALILVNTTEELKQDAIDYNRDKIIISILVTMFAIFFVVGLYTSYLYTNIRQLFKAIIAISKGNYARRIRLLTNIFTPFEIVFLGTEFNRMVNQIHKSYAQLKKKNKELKQLNEFRSNMIDTVSHEFRTPLTSIQGYTSRLLRQDIEIDEETKQKSLLIIKRQSERLKRMIEDLLVIPDIEGARLNVNLVDIPINTIIENSILLVKNNSGREIINNVQDCSTKIVADTDRIEQVFVNLIENAIKYAKDDTPVTIDCEEQEGKLVVSVKNEYEFIPREKLKTLFDKFTRMDDSTTRTTRGTGLGLFIVKGLVEAMDGEIRLYSTEENGFCVKVFMPIS